MLLAIQSRTASVGLTYRSEWKRFLLWAARCDLQPIGEIYSSYPGLFILCEAFTTWRYSWDWFRCLSFFCSRSDYFLASHGVKLLEKLRFPSLPLENYVKLAVWDVAGLYCLLSSLFTVPPLLQVFLLSLLKEPAWYRYTAMKTRADIVQTIAQLLSRSVIRVWCMSGWLPYHHPAFTTCISGKIQLFFQSYTT